MERRDPTSSEVKQHGQFSMKGVLHLVPLVKNNTPKYRTENV